MAQTVIGIFDTENEAQTAVQQLIYNGFSRDNIDLSVSNGTGTGNITSDNQDTDGDFGDSISNFFSSLFGSSSDESRNYSRVARRSTVVTVHARTNDEAEQAADILDQYGAVDVNERASQYRSNNLSSESSLNTANTATTSTVDTDRAIPIIEEELQVGKRVVETGGVRLRSRIIERPVEETLRLRTERVVVERNPVNRAATNADLNAFREGEIEMTEHAEVPVVNKDARVVEEISLSKEVEERDETIRDTVRRTDVEVDDLTRDKDDDLRRRENL